MVRGNQATLGRATGFGFPETCKQVEFDPSGGRSSRVLADGQDVDADRPQFRSSVTGKIVVDTAPREEHGFHLAQAK